ncbi:MAG: division/cell wall cluster transcriptional repressor MraZ [Sphingomonas sp.]
MAVEHLFRGGALNAVDAKGRLSVPAFIRQKIERRSDERLIVLARHAEIPCLIGYDSNYSAILWEESERRREKEADEGAELLVAFDRDSGLFGSAIEVPYDPSGRILLPGRLKKRARIDDLALFVGMGGSFAVWNPQVALESGPRQVRELAEDLLEERGQSS